VFAVATRQRARRACENRAMVHGGVGWCFAGRTGSVSIARIIISSSTRIHCLPQTPGASLVTACVKRSSPALESRGAIDGPLLDLYAGSGALGLEAASRGARSCDWSNEVAAAPLRVGQTRRPVLARRSAFSLRIEGERASCSPSPHEQSRDLGPCLCRSTIRSRRDRTRRRSHLARVAPRARCGVGIIIRRTTGGSAFHRRGNGSGRGGLRRYDAIDCWSERGVAPVGIVPRQPILSQSSVADSHRIGSRRWDRGLAATRIRGRVRRSG
jgi:hypothetical protein